MPCSLILYHIVLIQLYLPMVSIMCTLLLSVLLQKILNCTYETLQLFIAQNVKDTVYMYVL